jgi:hypothetical protein
LVFGEAGGNVFFLNRKCFSIFFLFFSKNTKNGFSIVSLGLEDSFYPILSHF